MNYVPLHVHTTVSPDGLGTIQNLMGRVSELGMTHCACTDHGTLAAAVAFSMAAFAPIKIKQPPPLVL